MIHVLVSDLITKSFESVCGVILKKVGKKRGIITVNVNNLEGHLQNYPVPVEHREVCQIS